MKGTWSVSRLLLATKTHPGLSPAQRHKVAAAAGLLHRTKPDAELCCRSPFAAFP